MPVDLGSPTCLSTTRASLDLPHTHSKQQNVSYPLHINLSTQRMSCGCSTLQRCLFYPSTSPSNHIAHSFQIDSPLFQNTIMNFCDLPLLSCELCTAIFAASGIKTQFPALLVTFWIRDRLLRKVEDYMTASRASNTLKPGVASKL